MKAETPGGVLEYKRDPKKYMDLILCTQKDKTGNSIQIMLSDLAGTLA